MAGAARASKVAANSCSVRYHHQRRYMKCTVVVVIREVHKQADIGIPRTGAQELVAVAAVRARLAARVQVGLTSEPKAAP